LGTSVTSQNSRFWLFVHGFFYGDERPGKISHHVLYSSYSLKNVFNQDQTKAWLTLMSTTKINTKLGWPNVYKQDQNKAWLTKRYNSQNWPSILISSLTFMSLTTCWKRPPRAEHSLSRLSIASIFDFWLFSRVKTDFFLFLLQNKTLFFSLNYMAAKSFDTFGINVWRKDTKS